MLQRLSQLQMMADRLSVDIWIDRLPNGSMHRPTLAMAQRLASSFQNGRACVHRQTMHAYITTQWLDTYRPKLDTREVGIILEDDIDLSRFAWKWYKALHDHFRHADYIAGYTLKSQDKYLRAIARRKEPLVGPKNHTILLYNCFQAWAYSPQPNVWREYQDWYHTVRKNKNNYERKSKVDSIDPRVPGALHSEWWTRFSQDNYQETMAHEMFNVYFTNVVKQGKLYTVYQNLDVYTGRDIRLCVNRKEAGLHFSGKELGEADTSKLLLADWQDDFIKFPVQPRRLTITGEIVKYK